VQQVAHLVEISSAERALSETLPSTRPGGISSPSGDEIRADVIPHISCIELNRCEESNPSSGLRAYAPHKKSPLS
jgi:hypothetical protein